MRAVLSVMVVALLVVASGRVGSALQRNGVVVPTQNQVPDFSASKPGGSLTPGMPDIGDPATRREMEEKRGNMLNVERQRAMVREAGQLVQMTAELQASLAKDPQLAAREEELRRIDTIEKLARNVKDRMRGGR